MASVLEWPGVNRVRQWGGGCQPCLPPGLLSCRQCGHCGAILYDLHGVCCLPTKSLEVPCALSLGGKKQLCLTRGTVGN